MLAPLFEHHLHRPENPDGSTIVLLHGTGGDENDLMPLAAQIAPKATLLGVRGRSTEEGIFRWFRRYDAVTYDQQDIRNESKAFSAFMQDANAHYRLDPARTTYLGYSNGANLLAAIIQLHPGAISRAVLLRGIQPLEDVPQGNFSSSKVLLLSGADDPFSIKAPALVAALRKGNAVLDAHTITAGHGLTQADMDIARDWMNDR